MRQTAGLVVIYESKILLVRHKIDKTGARLSIPKGRIEPGETPLEAAIRETMEETGLYISLEDVSPTPYLINCSSELLMRRIIYYVVYLDTVAKINIQECEEILEAGFYSYQEACSCLQITQQAVLLHLKPDVLPVRYMEWLLIQGYITVEQHFASSLIIFNYTDLCKKDQYWDEVTLWCRGLIASKDDGEIRYRPFKKFFELHQLYDHFIPDDTSDFEIYEKYDGALGILYWRDDKPYVATRNSFMSTQAIRATSLLYARHYNDFPNLNRNYTYMFEIIMPENPSVVDYGDSEELILIGCYDNVKHRDISVVDLKLDTFKILQPLHLKDTISHLLKKDIIGREGYVLRFSDGLRLKIKFPSYKSAYLAKYDSKQ